MLNENGEVQQKTVFDMKMEDYDGTEIIIDKEYTPPKSEMDLWKEMCFEIKVSYLIKYISLQVV